MGRNDFSHQFRKTDIRYKSIGMWKKSPQRVLSYYQLRGLVVQVNHLRFFPVIYDLLGASVRKITCVTLARGQP